MEGIETERARERLESDLARVQDLIRQKRIEVGDEVEGEQAELADYDQHPADMGTDTFEREKDLSILEALEAEQAEIEAALARIDAGTYGIDERTGDPIDPARLEAVPTARTNVTPRGADAAVRNRPSRERPGAGT